MNELVPNHSVSEMPEGQAAHRVLSGEEDVPRVQARCIRNPGVDGGSQAQSAVEAHGGNGPARVRQSALARRIFTMRTQGYSEEQVARKLRLPVGVVRREIADL